MPFRRLGVVVFCVGAASLGAEIAAARLLAPWFGASTIVWANTIATVLVALSVGYWLGGRLADRDPRPAGLSRLVLAASILLAAVPFLSGPFLRASADALDSVSPGGFAGSLVAVLALVAVPVLLLGTVSPYAVRLAVTSVEEAGRVTGRLYAISTAGSLVGTFLSALVLIPLAGTRRTFLAFALVLAVVGVAGLGRRVLVLVPLALAGLVALPVGGVKAADTGAGRVIWERETEYQYARVVEEPSGRRRLELNEGHAVHSVYAPGRWLTGDYWDDLLVAPAAALGRLPRRVAILGDAGGTTARALAHFSPRTQVDGVEIDPELNAVARQLFGLRPGPRLRLHAADARTYLRHAPDGGFDAILVDAYRQPYIPFHLVTREFFALAREKLAPGGVVVVNVGHPDDSDRLEKVLTATLRSEFPTVLRDPAQPTNTQLVATAAVRAGGARLRTAALPGPLRSLAAVAAARLAPGLGGGEVYTDDHAPVEWLIDSSLLRYAAHGGR